MSGLQWALVNGEKEEPTLNSWKKTREHHFSNVSSSSTTTTTSTSSRPIPKGMSPVNHGAQYSSAPLEVPDWSKIYGNKEVNVEHYRNDDEDDDYDGKMIPPHDYIAKRLAKAKISSFSMCEGNGRTLKGRDLRKVRNEVLTKTGFLE